MMHVARGHSSVGPSRRTSQACSGEFAHNSSPAQTALVASPGTAHDSCHRELSSETRPLLLLRWSPRSLHIRSKPFNSLTIVYHGIQDRRKAKTCRGSRPCSILSSHVCLSASRLCFALPLSLSPSLSFSLSLFLSFSLSLFLSFSLSLFLSFSLSLFLSFSLSLFLSLSLCLFLSLSLSLALFFLLAQTIFLAGLGVPTAASTSMAEGLRDCGSHPYSIQEFETAL